MLTILDLCDTVEMLETFKLIRIVINIIRYIVPIILILSMSTTLMSLIKKGDSKDILKQLMPKAMAAILIFFVPLFVKMLLQVTNSSSQYYQCFEMATSSGIESLKVNNANKAIQGVKKNISYISYNNAVNHINKVKDSSTKEALQNELNKLNEFVKLSNEIDNLRINFDRDKYLEISNKVSKISEKDIKEQLEKKLEQISIQKPINVDAGVYQASSSTLTYYVHIPKNATTNMPLVLYLHGDGGQVSAQHDIMYYRTIDAYGQDFPYILLSPAGGMWAETSGRIAAVKNIVDVVCNKYKCDTSRISVVGHSRGAIGTWAIVNQYPGFFHSAIPISCRGNINGANFVKTKLRAYCGNVGQDLNYISNMKSNVSKINSAGGNAQYYQLNTDHGGTPEIALSKANLEWLIN